MDYLQPGQGANRKEIRLLFTCAGRRIQLIQAFAQAARVCQLQPFIHTSDSIPWVAARCVADQGHLVPPIEADEYIPALLEIARQEKIDLLIPTLDTELLKLARARDQFHQIGCGVLISSPNIIELCGDKISTYEFLIRSGIPTPATWPAPDALSWSHFQFPYFLKPRSGSASKENFVLRNEDDLRSLVPYLNDSIIQEFIPGVEYTLDAYTDLTGHLKCIVPRRRLEVRGGEVTRSLTVKDQLIINTGKKVIQALGECRGMITIQLIMTSDRRPMVIEINPRFGGGVPLAIRAGADFPRWLLHEWKGHSPESCFDDFQDGVTMLRYHQAFYIDRHENLI